MTQFAPNEWRRTENTHRLLGACSCRGEMLLVESSWILDAGLSGIIPFTAHWHCLVVGRQTSEFLPSR